MGQVQGELEEAIDRGCRANAFSGAALVAQHGRVVTEKACGFASRRYGALNRIDTRFNLGSANKMFTAVAAMQLVERGELSLDEAVAKHLDGSWLPHELSRQIKVRHLLTHSSGLGSFFSDDFEASSRLRFRELEDYKPLVRDERLAFAPGSAFKYSDTGMLLLGAVIEKASGQRYFDYVRDHIFKPTRMSDTDFWPIDEPVTNLAMGHGWAPDTEFGWRENTLRHVLRGNPAGGGYSTVGDLFRFAQALQAGSLISKTSLAYLWTDNAPNNYGGGFTVSSTVAGRAVGHDGLFSGISTRVSIYPDSNDVVVLLGNQDYAAPGLNDALEEIIARRPIR